MMEATIRKISEENLDSHREQRYIEYLYPDSKDIDRFMFQWKTRRYLEKWPVIRERHEPDRDYHFRIDTKSYRLPRSLKHIANQIEEAREILTYEDDWDDEGACPTDIATFENAISFIIDYSGSIYDKTGIVLKSPYIDILRDGSVSVHWESDHAQLLIIFKKGNSELAYYYAETKDSKVPLKSAIKPGKPVDEFLELWMKKNLF